MLVKNYKIGADPELFLEQNGEIISAEGLIGGTKKDPKLISDEGHAVQEDNVMVEFNIPPCNNVDEFLFNINYSLNYLKNICTLYGDIKLNYSASAKLNKKYLKTAQAKEFGCEPDFNVYLKEQNPRVICDSNSRHCGGHIHIGYDNPNQETTEKIVYAMDMTLGLQSLSMDKDVERRKLYGKAGSFRFKEYGLEWRSISNFWIANDELIKWAYETAESAIKLVNSGKIDNLIDKYALSVQDIIDNHKVEESKKLLDKIYEEIGNKKEKYKELILS